MKTEKIRILLIDDSEIELVLFKNSLEQAGFDVLTTTDSSRAASYAEQFDPDFVILDLFMPNSNGKECCKQLKSNPRTMQIPIIFLTSSGDAEDVITSIHLGVIDYFQKPVDIAEFIASIKKHDVVHKIREAWQPTIEAITRVRTKYKV